MLEQFHPLRGAELLIRPRETVQKIISEKPGVTQGLLYLIVYLFLFDFAFLLFLAFSNGLESFNAGNVGMMLLALGVSFVISLFISLILVLWSSVVFRIASRILKGTGSFGSEVGIVGTISSSMITACFIGFFFLLIIAKLLLSPFLTESSLAQFFFWGVVFEGLALLLLSVFLTSLLSSATEIISKLEALDVYKSSGIFGLILGSALFMFLVLMLLLYVAVIGLATLSIPSSQSSGYDLSPVIAMGLVGILVNLVVFFFICFLVIPTISIVLVALIKFIESKTKKDMYLISRLIGLAIGIVILMGFVLLGLFMSLIMEGSQALPD